MRKKLDVSNLRLPESIEKIFNGDITYDTVVKYHELKAKWHKHMVKFHKHYEKDNSAAEDIKYHKGFIRLHTEMAMVLKKGKVGCQPDELVWNALALAELEKELDELRRQIAIKDRSLREKNLALDALHFVWCSGGCEGGVHRWQETPLTLEIVEEAERNTLRLRQWWESNKAKESEAKG